MIIDTHAHYNLEPLYSDWKMHWEKAQAYGVVQSLVVGSTLEDSLIALEIAKAEKGLYATMGIHPSHFSVSEKQSNADLDATLLHMQMSCKKQFEAAGETDAKNGEQDIVSRKLVAIGEIGLDYFRLEPTDKKSRDQQKHYFIEQLKIAKTYSLPVIIHSRDTSDEAYTDIYEIVSANVPNDYPVLLHCISGPQEYLKKMVQRGAYIGVGGNSTYKNADHIRELITLTPPDRILLETDAPYLPPHPHRGNVCEPWMISLTAEYIYELTNTTPKQILENTYRFFADIPRIDYNTSQD